MTKEISIIDFNKEQVALIKSQIAKDCNDNELELFLYQCKQTGLNPLTRQIYAIKRGGRMTIQTSIDGFRVIAERSGLYAGQDEPVWEGDDNTPTKCTVKVYKFTPNYEQRYCAGVGVAHFKEYYPNPILLQKTMPRAMLAKVAEALALRKAYPQDLSGLYTGDEMIQADNNNNAKDVTPKNNNGITQSLADSVHQDQAKTFEQFHQEEFKRLSNKINLCKSEKELQLLIKDEAKILNTFKRQKKEFANELGILWQKQKEAVSKKEITGVNAKQPNPKDFKSEVKANNAPLTKQEMEDINKGKDE